jgi:hypothetical protein
LSGASVLQTEAYSAAIGAFVLIQSILAEQGWRS